MKNRLNKTPGFQDFNENGTLCLRSTLNLLQEAALTHGNKAGCGLKQLMGRGKAWILHRMCLRIHTLPRFGERLTIFTWHKGIKGVKGYRDFEIYNGEVKIISAASIWLFFDFKRRKLMPVPADIGALYSIEAGSALDTDMDISLSNDLLVPENEYMMDVRISDFDPLGHVNNAVYLDFIETAVCMAFSPTRRIREVFIQFSKEIPKTVSRVGIGMMETGNGHEFKLHSSGVTHAAGTFRLFSRN